MDDKKSLLFSDHEEDSFFTEPRTVNCPKEVTFFAILLKGRRWSKSTTNLPKTLLETLCTGS